MNLFWTLTEITENCPPNLEIEEIKRNIFPRLTTELPQLPPMNLENRVTTRETVLEFYHKQMGY